MNKICCNICGSEDYKVSRFHIQDYPPYFLICVDCKSITGLTKEQHSSAEDYFYKCIDSGMSEYEIPNKAYTPMSNYE